MDFVPPFWPRTPEEIRTRAPRGEGFTGRANLASRLNGPGSRAAAMPMPMPMGALGARPGRSLGPPSQVLGLAGAARQATTGDIVADSPASSTGGQRSVESSTTRRWRAAATTIYVLRRGLRSRRAVSGHPAPRERRLRRRAGRLRARASLQRGGSARRGCRTTAGGRLAGRGAPGCCPRQTRVARDYTEGAGGRRQGAANAGLRPPACIAIS